MADPEKMNDAELDIAIAVEVMGWKRDKHWVSKRTDFMLVTDGEDSYRVGAQVLGFTRNWSPSTAFNEAMSALEAARRIGIDIDVSADSECGWTLCAGDAAAKFVFDSGGIVRFDQLPRAICIVVINAIRAKQESGK